jgi:hypothetical protein
VRTSPDPPSPELGQGTKPYTVCLHKALTKHLHLALQALTHSCTKPTSHALSRSMTSNYFLHHLATYLYITKRA